MNQILFDHYLMREYQRRHEELIKEVELDRLAREASRNGRPRTSNPSKILARIGKELTVLGESLEQKYGDNAKSQVVIHQPSSTEGCA